MKRIRCQRVLRAVTAVVISAGAVQAQDDITHDKGPGTRLSLSLAECIEHAIANNHARPASRLAVEIAEAQHQQALSSYWPRATLSSSLSRRDEDPTYIFPEDTDLYSFNLGAGDLAANVTVPAKHIKLQDKLHSVTDVDVVLPLYTGGLRGALLRQTEAGIAAAQQVSRRTDLEVVYDVKRIYHAAVLADNLVDIGQEALARLEVTLELTENLYQRGSGSVKKTDWLAHKVVVEGLRSVVVRLLSNRELARAALGNTIGLPWDSVVEPSATAVPFTPVDLVLADLVGASYRFNPDWSQLLAGLEARAAQVDEARSGRMPKVALVGNLEYIVNSHDEGIVGDSEKKSWLVAVGLEVPLFDGFLTRNRIREAQARLARLEHQQVRLREGLGLQVKALFLELMRAQGQEAASGAALEAAEQNRSLNARAYQDQLVEVQDVIQSQLMESFARAVYEKVRYDHAQARAHLEQVVGTELLALVSETR